VQFTQFSPSSANKSRLWRIREGNLQWANSLKSAPRRRLPRREGPKIEGKGEFLSAARTTTDAANRDDAARQKRLSCRAPKIDHILVEVSDLKASIAFYRDFLGLRLKSQSDWFVMLESDNVGVFLRNSRWDWEKRSGKREQLGLGMYSELGYRLFDRFLQNGRKVAERLKRRRSPYSRKSPILKIHRVGIEPITQ
jgi:hypothetical protein